MFVDALDPAVGSDGLLRPGRLDPTSRPLFDDRGQATTEYAMVLVVVAVVAVALFTVGPTALRKIFGAVVDFVMKTIPGGG